MGDRLNTVTHPIAKAMTCLARSVSCMVDYLAFSLEFAAAQIQSSKVCNLFKVRETPIAVAIQIDAKVADTKDC